MVGKRKGKTVRSSLAALLAIGIAGTATAQTEIPEGAVITSATLSIYADLVQGWTIDVHRVTADWDELGVTWNNFGSSYAPGVEGSFVADAVGWQSVDVTALVIAWLDGTYPNFGVVLKQGQTEFTRYMSSEVTNVVMRPKLEIDYTTADGNFSVTIQRPGGEYEDVADAYIWETLPDTNEGHWIELYTGLYGEKEKFTLIRFDVSTAPPSDVGTGTPGYWKNHPDAWPVDEITIGGIVYSKWDAIMYMKSSNKKDKTITMFRSLVAAQLNVLIGNEYDCVSSTMVAADIWMAAFPVGSGVPGGGPDSPWREGNPLYEELDDYNNGLLCAPSRDSLEY